VGTQLFARRNIMKVLVIGGTGVISRAIVPQLLAKQHEVTLYNRGSKSLSFAGQVRQITGDRADRETFKTSLQKESFDVVIDMVCFFEPDAHSTLETFSDRVQQIIVCSSIAAYKRPYQTVPVREDAETLWEDPIFSGSSLKGVGKAVFWVGMGSDRLGSSLL